MSRNLRMISYELNKIKTYSIRYDLNWINNLLQVLMKDYGEKEKYVVSKRLSRLIVHFQNLESDIYLRKKNQKL